MNKQTKRLTLRDVMGTDDVSILRAVRCPQIAFMYGNQFSSIDKVRQYIQVLEKEYGNGNYRTLAIATKDSDTLIGLITLDRDRIFPRAEVSYWIDESHRNQGYATEAVQGIIDYAFTELSINRLQATHFTDNPASGRVLEKAGMLYEGTLRQYVGMGDTFFDCKMYAILRDDFV